MPDPAKPRRPFVPIPAGGFQSNEDEATWLAQVLLLRVNELLAIAGVSAHVEPKGLRQLLLLSLDSASRRGRGEAAARWMMERAQANPA